MWTKFGFASKNPMVPTVHANWRYFEMYDTSTELSTGPRKVIQAMVWWRTRFNTLLFV
jgi:hypothetical protein